MAHANTSTIAVSAVETILPAAGAIDPEACNYDAEATIEDGTCILGGQALTISVGGGSWDSEIGWALESGDGVVVQGNAGALTECVAPGCYTFSMTDSYGDGWNGATYTLTDADGVLVASGDLDSAQNGDGSTAGWLIQFGDADCGLGCTDAAACNYDESATLDDGTCNYDCNGCTDPEACNYDADATEDDGVLHFRWLRCDVVHVRHLRRWLERQHVDGGWC